MRIKNSKCFLCSIVWSLVPSSRLGSQGYFRIRQTAEHLRKKKEEEREARRREREVEKTDGVDQKSKLEELPPAEDLKDKEKVSVHRSLSD